MSSRAVVGQVLGHYRILEPLGAGGMGEVYRARDTQLERDVALKFLRFNDSSDASARARLLHEARAASRLNHPNICTIYEVAEAAGHCFIVMEFVAGELLEASIRNQPMSPDRALEYGLQMADAMAHAHEHQIIHRDLKSANVMITANRVKVLDFGLAKRGTAQDLTLSTKSLSLIQPQAVAGTLAYMAPEQLRGLPADARSDIWALGVVLYEMITGRLPFRGDTAFEVSSAILLAEPTPFASIANASLATVIRRCLEKAPSRRYQSSGELRSSLEEIQHSIPKRHSAIAARRPRRSVGAIVSVVLLTAALLFGAGRLRTLFSKLPRIESIAVLPLENLSGDPQQEYLADGMTEALITDLTHLSGLKRVSPRGSVMTYRGSKKTLSEIARELRVDALITGAVVRSGGRVRITAQLINGHTEDQLWSDGYERDLRDIVALQSEITRAVAAGIRMKLDPQEQQRLSRARPVNPEAYDAYLNGRFHVSKRAREEKDIAEKYFQLALERDPNYAPAYVGLGETWYLRANDGFIAPSDAYPKFKTAMAKALDLDESLLEAHTWLANFAWTTEWDYDAAEREFQRAIALGPNDAETHFFYADFLITLKRNTEWQREIKRVFELDPVSSFYHIFYGWHLIYLGRYDEAIAELERVAASEPNDSAAHLGLWGAYYKKKDYANAIAESAKFFSALHDDEAVAALTGASSEGEYRSHMKRAADILARRARKTNVSATRVARLYAHAADNENALEWLERAYDRRENNLVHIGVGWDWDSQRPDPRFQALLRRMNLPIS